MKLGMRGPVGLFQVVVNIFGYLLKYGSVEAEEEDTLRKRKIGCSDFRYTPRD